MPAARHAASPVAGGHEEPAGSEGAEGSGSGDVPEVPAPRRAPAHVEDFGRDRRSRGSRRRSAARGVLVAAVVAQLVWILVGGLWGVLRAPAPSTIDEAAHLDVVLHLLREDERPVLSDPAQPDVVAAALGTTPGDVPREGLDPREVRLPRWSYEAFQPPLYYLAVAPVAALAGGGDAGTAPQVLRALRFVDLGLLLATAGLVVALARSAVPRAPLLATALGLLPLGLPGLLQAQTAVTDTALELPLALLLVLLLVRAYRRGSGRALVGAGVVLGLLLLTRTTTVALVPLHLVVVAVLAVRLRSRRALLTAGLALLAPLLVVAPELVWTSAVYGTWTAAVQAEAQQVLLGLPSADLGAGSVLRELPSFWRTALLPEQAAHRRLPATALLVALLLLVVVLPLALAVRGALRPAGTSDPAVGAVAPSSRHRGTALVLVAPLLLVVALLAGTAVVTDVPVLRGRYAYAALPPLLVAGAAGLVASRRPGARLQAGTGAAALVTTVLLVAAGLHAEAEQCRPGRPVCSALPPTAADPLAVPPLPGDVAQRAGVRPEAAVREVALDDGRSVVLLPDEDAVVLRGRDGARRLPLRGGPVDAALDPARDQLAVLLREGAVVVLDVAGDSPVPAQRFAALPGAVDVQVRRDATLVVTAADGRVQTVPRAFPG